MRITEQWDLLLLFTIPFSYDTIRNLCSEMLSMFCRKGKISQVPLENIDHRQTCIPNDMPDVIGFGSAHSISEARVS